MILFAQASFPGRITALFGQGVIGSAIGRNMRLGGFRTIQSFKIHWDSFRVDNSLYRSLSHNLAAAITQAVTSSPDDYLLNVVWATGKAGFTSDQNATEADLNTFFTILKLIEEFQRDHPSCPIGFFHLSSAGGLFEGQSCISSESVPRPVRPYGWIKLMQEQALLSCPIRMRRVIYRPSSVYGKIRTNHRMGLIPTMILNGLRQTVTSIYGFDDTLRDFVWVEDVARHICDDLRRPITQDIIKTLHSGRPVCLYEVRSTIERFLNKKLFFQFSTAESNSLPITFSHRCKTENWRTTSLATAVQQIVVDHHLSRYDFWETK